MPTSNKVRGSRTAPALELVRIGGGEHDVIGVLLLDGRVIAVTLELAYRANKRAVSSIPHGVYLCKRVQSPKHGNTFEIYGVPDRTAILFHAGNSANDSQGCVLLGAALGETRPDGLRTVIGSRIARDRFRDELAGCDAVWLRVGTLPDVSRVVASLSAAGA